MPDFLRSQAASADIMCEGVPALYPLVSESAAPLAARWCLRV